MKSFLVGLLLLALMPLAHAELRQGQYVKVKAVTAASYTASLVDEEILVNATGAASTVTLPSATGRAGKVFTVRKTDSSANAVTVMPLGQKLNVISDRVSVMSDGSSWVYKEKGVAQTLQKFTFGTGTYTTPSGVKYIRVRLVGGGGGGGGSGTSNPSTEATAGGNTTFGSSLLTANGGNQGGWADNGGTGGTASLGTGPVGIALQGAKGGDKQYSNVAAYTGGGHGGVSPFGGAGSAGGYGSVGGSSVANTGSGGGGAGIPAVANAYSGGGGGAGGFIDAIITNPAASYDYAVGAAGGAGGAGTSGAPGGLGGSGVIIVEEFY